MPKTKLQEVVFTILMVFVMVYAMICYNISLNMGGMSNIVFLNAFHELVIMGPIAFILDFFLYGSLSKKLVILSILVYTFFTRMFDFMLPLVVKYSIVAA